MAEAQPSKKVGGHAYGRRIRQMSNTAEEGELCIYTGHSLGRFSTHSMRYDSHQACVRCVAGAREGRLSFDISKLLKKNKKQIIKLSNEVDELRDNIFYFIKNLDESSVGASGFYIDILGYLHDMVQSLEYISKVTYKHVDNNHKKLKFKQIKELSEISDAINELFTEAKDVFETQSFDKIESISERKNDVYKILKSNIALGVSIILIFVFL